jgi:hypothetical protein
VPAALELRVGEVLLDGPGPPRSARSARGTGTPCRRTRPASPCDEATCILQHLARNRFVVAVDELWRAGLSAQWRATLPGVPIGPPRTVCQRLGDRVYALKAKRAGSPVATP